MLAVYIIGGIILVFLLVAALVGTKWQFERSILINVPLEKVWQNTNSLHAINSWNSWLDRDTNLRQEYTGTDGAPGAACILSFVDTGRDSSNATRDAVWQKVEAILQGKSRSMSG